MAIGMSRAALNATGTTPPSGTTTSAFVWFRLALSANATLCCLSVGQAGAGFQG